VTAARRSALPWPHHGAFTARPAPLTLMAGCQPEAQATQARNDNHPSCKRPGRDTKVGLCASRRNEVTYVDKRACDIVTPEVRTYSYKGALR